MQFVLHGAYRFEKRQHFRFVFRKQTVSFRPEPAKNGRVFPAGQVMLLVDY